MEFPIEMYKIYQENIEIIVPCERCIKGGNKNESCSKCGGIGVYNSSINIWKIDPVPVMITDIDRASKNRYYKGKQVCYEGGLRYWAGVGDFFNEGDKYLHFTREDAQDECDRRNKGIIDVIKNYVMETA